jgi:biopolymer transport protein TolQ
MIFLLETNPFIQAFADSDLLGRSIFGALIALSIVSWSVIIHKMWITKRVKRESFTFRKSFVEQRSNPLEIRYSGKSNPECPNAFFIIYEILKNKTREVLDKNQKVVRQENKNIDAAYLCASDVGLLDASGQTAISSLTKYLEKNLYILSTTVTLAPFLGLLGTVWGILTAFSGMKNEAMGMSNQMVLGGLSLALTSTVLGLVDAIPALIGYNYLKNVIYDFDAEMGRFANDVLCSLELHYRRVD